MHPDVKKKNRLSMIPEMAEPFGQKKPIIIIYEISLESGRRSEPLFGTEAQISRSAAELQSAGL